MAMTPKLAVSKYVAYYRVSTDKQGKSKLGLEAQVHTVEGYLAQNPERELFASFREVESASRKTRLRACPVLDAALELAKQTKAILLIAKLDRLKRDVEFIAHLMNAHVKFIALDIPEADEFTIHIYAAFAQRESMIIAKRTSEAIQAKLARGEKWGNPQNLRPEFSHLSRIEAQVARETQAKLFAEKMKPTLSFYLQNGYSLNKIATEMNRLQFTTPTGLIGKWTPTTVKNCLARSQ
jgi:DNA invertase Pin-like site-specific DNA recombinase